MNRISEGERLVKLMLFIKENGPVGFEDIRAHFREEYGSKTGNLESVRRRFERDKRSLQKLGIYLIIDDNNCYTLDECKSFAAPVDLTSSQTSLIRLVCGTLLEDKDYAFKSDLRMVLIKLGDELGVPDLLPQMDVEKHPASKTGAALRGIEKVRKSITMRKRLSFDYSSASGHQSSREVEPFGCFIFKSYCYVVAFDPEAAEERCFRLDRMQHMHVNAAGPEKPDFKEREFDARKYYGLPFQFGEEKFDAHIRINASEAWHCDHITMGQGAIEPDDGGMLWTVPCNDTQVLVRWCIEHAPGVELIGPDHAVRAYREGISQAISAIEEVAR